MTALGQIVRCDRLHGTPFGTVTAVRNDLGRSEYQVDYSTSRFKATSWVDLGDVETVTLDVVKDYYEDLLTKERQRSKRLGELVGKKVPKFNPKKHLGDMAEHLCDAYRHEDGSITYVFPDPNPDIESPREYDGNVATLIQLNSRIDDIDEDEAGLKDARDYFNGGRNDAMFRRYLAMFRPDIAYYCDHWSAGDSYGWGYVTRENFIEGCERDLLPHELAAAEKAFDAEVEVYGLWANNEVYASAHIAKPGDEVDMVFGHLGYDSSEDIAGYHTQSPILEVLA